MIYRKIKNILDLHENDFMNLPIRQWDIKKTYHSIFVEKTNEKHDSGFCIMRIVGLSFDKDKYIELEEAGTCDHIRWEFENMVLDLENDMLFMNKLIRFYSFQNLIEVGISLSTTKIRLINKTENQ